MCLATPMQLTRIDGEYGFVEHDGKEYKLQLSLIENPKVGDWLFAHGELAVSKLPSEDAEKILELIESSKSTV